MNTDDISFVDSTTNKDNITFTKCDNGDLEIVSMMFEDTIGVETIIYINRIDQKRLKVFLNGTEDS